ncbi:hypothetical protein KOW79_014586 [Hemibagrus wyckioides]|uniref:Uncharacterized protein n=1 Tax=Hemibagrus wyckioides TaxID=337641 RepID=A0A9D3NF21_9TELE|nr:hypothetical protein KOW79_014586 [Hemibagrus wyckioides]
MAASSASPAGPSKSDFPRRQARRLTSWREGPVPWPGTVAVTPAGQFRFSAPGVRCRLWGGAGFKALDVLDPRCTKAGS